MSIILSICEEHCYLFMECGLASVVLRTSWSHSLPMLQRWRQKHEGAFRDTLSVFVYCTSWCRGLGGGRNGGAKNPCSAFSPLIIPTPFCTQCYAVEHENKNILSQESQVSRHKLVRGLPRNLFSLLLSHQFWQYYFGDLSYFLIFGVQPYI